MPVRVIRKNLSRPADTRDDGPEFVEVPFENRVTEVDGQAFHWGTNQVRSFSDDGVGIKHTTMLGTATIVQDNRPFDALS